jgi:hypothetical protein
LRRIEYVAEPPARASGASAVDEMTQLAHSALICFAHVYSYGGMRALPAPRLLMSSNLGCSASLSIGPTAPIEANVGALIRISNTRVRQTVLRSRNKSKLAGRLGKLE